MSKHRIIQLRDILIKAKQAYYFGGKPIMPDTQYDAFEDELRELSPNDPVLSIVGAPVPPDHILEKAEHRMHMGSQSKVNTEAEMRAWVANHSNKWVCDECGYVETQIGTITSSPHCPDCESAMHPTNFHVSYKGDGGSAAAYYEGGNLVQVISRGDGKIGEDITAAALKFQGLPTYVEYEDEPFTGSVRFEVILDKDVWQEIGGKNPRNMGNGIMGRKDGVQAECLKVYSFDIKNGVDFKTEAEKSSTMEAMGFSVMPWTVVEDADELVEYYNQTMETRGPNNSGSLPFWIDGIVIKLNDLSIQDQLGYSSDGKTHRGQVSWKPEAEGAITVLKDVVLSCGHTGAIIPNGRLEPVNLGGVTITNVLLNNWDFIAALDVAVGDRVFVSRRNDVIPYVEKVVERVYECPECGFRGTLTEQEEHHS